MRIRAYVLAAHQAGTKTKEVPLRIHAGRLRYLMGEDTYVVKIQCQLVLQCDANRPSWPGAGERTSITIEMTVKS